MCNVCESDLISPDPVEMVRKPREGELMSDQIKGILFDKDGTLFDFHTTWSAWAEKFFVDVARNDHARAKELAAALGYHFETRSFDRDSIIIAGTPEEEAAALAAYLPDWTVGELVRHVNKVASEVPQAQPDSAA